MRIETDLARASRKLQDLRDPYKNYNAMEEKRLQTQEMEEFDILEGILEEETNILQPDMNVAAIPSEIEPKATMPSVGEITPSPPSSLDK